jgi:hypothetical protein
MTNYERYQQLLHDAFLEYLYYRSHGDTEAEAFRMTINLNIETLHKVGSLPGNQEYKHDDI